MSLNDEVAADQLRSYVERVERLLEEKATLAADIREAYAEAKANGFDTKVMRQVVRLRAMDAETRETEASLLELYLRTLGIPT